MFVLEKQVNAIYYSTKSISSVSGAALGKETNLALSRLRSAAMLLATVLPAMLLDREEIITAISNIIYSYTMHTATSNQS